LYKRTWSKRGKELKLWLAKAFDSLKGTLQQALKDAQDEREVLLFLFIIEDASFMELSKTST